MSTGIETENAGKPRKWFMRPKNLTQLWLEGWEMGEIRDTHGDVEAENAIRDYVAKRLGLGKLRFGRRRKLSGK